ncbi:uncharacterized protein LOC121369985 [Gigantopelta aegis]|uniref:uncharacterized protein LOC121369985 n=1 Tax=Gigantopelta aegis TaxID=1735272 RepID=UPI001B88E1E4|nr:uncharacterized protein LOC121369985 [Gigantopelta aegis]
MADVQDGGPGEKEQSKPDSPKPDQEVAPPLISKDAKDEKTGQKKGTQKVTNVAKTTTLKSKSVVSAGDALKEAQKARAYKEENKLKLDARHQYVIKQIADAIGLDPSAVEDFLTGDEKFDLIDDFFAKDGIRKLIFFYQNADIVKPGQSTTQPKKLFLTLGDAEVNKTDNNTQLFLTIWINET